MTEFFIDGEPPHTTSQKKGVRIVRKRATGKMIPLFFQKANVAEAEAYFARGIFKHKPPAPLAGPIRLEVVFVFGWTKADQKRRIKGAFEECAWKTTKPDVDNAAKLLGDCLTSAGFWGDDSQVCETSLRKLYGDRPGVFISISVLEDRLAMPPIWWRLK